MKTNIVMNSKHDRNLFGVIIRQETKSEMLSLTDLQEAYTHARVLNGWAEKRVAHIINQKENAERIYYLLVEQGILTNVSINEFFKVLDEKGIIQVLKELNCYKCYGRGKNKIVFCQKLIWLLICEELSPEFYADVLKFLFNGASSIFDFVAFDASEYETNQQSRLNHENAWRYFYPEGDGSPKKGYCLHHINPEWRYFDKERYNQWNIDDLQMMTNSEHMALHQKIGFGKKSTDIQLIDACDLNKNLRSVLCRSIENPDYAEINRALNIKIFGKHETGMRNLASEKELAVLNKLQENIAFCIQRGFLKTNEEIINEINRVGV